MLTYAAISPAPAIYAILAFRFFIVPAPIFPPLNSADFLEYVKATVGLIHPYANPLSYAILPIFSTIAPPVSIVRYLIIIFGSFTVVAIHDLASSIYGDRRAGMISSYLMALTSPFLYPLINASGLLANAIGILLSISAASISLSRLPGARRYPLGVTAWLTALAAHSTSVLALIALLVYSAFEKHDRILRATMLTILGAIAASLAIGWGSMEGRLAGLIRGPGPVFVYTQDEVSRILVGNTLTKFFGFVYVHGGYSYLVLMMISLPMAVITIRRNRGQSILIVWILGAYLASLLTPNAGRLAPLATVPLTPLVYTLIRPALKVEVDVMRFVYAGLILGVIVGASVWPLAGYSVYEATAMKYSGRQREAYRAMLWMQKNLPKGARVAGVVAPEVLYVNYLWTGRGGGHLKIVGDFYGQPDIACREILRRGGADYIVVWARVHENNTYLIDYYLSDPRFKPVYNNTEYYVFKVLGCFEAQRP